MSGVNSRTLSQISMGLVFVGFFIFLFSLLPVILALFSGDIYRFQIVLMVPLVVLVFVIPWFIFGYIMYRKKQNKPISLILDFILSLFLCAFVIWKWAMWLYSSKFLVDKSTMGYLTSFFFQWDFGITQTLFFILVLCHLYQLVKSLFKQHQPS